MIPALYVHIPICLKKCDYCDFFSVPLSSFPHSNTSISPLAELVNALLSEIVARKKEFSVTRWETVYIGGGTPSLLAPSDVFRLGSEILSMNEGQKEEEAEFTIEANPEDLTESWLLSCAEAGINRLSLGIQSMDDEILSAIGRRGCGASNRKALDLVRRIWRGTFSVDLISGLPGQNLETLRSDIHEIISYNPQHISLYSLTIEEGTPLDKRLSGPFPPLIPDEDESASLWIEGRNILEQNGYHQYEISNFAQNGFESRHNMIYWNLKTYIGVGPGATGTILDGESAHRNTNTADIAKWLIAPAESFSTEYIGRADCIRETLLMGMRTASGIDRKRFNDRFGEDILRLFGNVVRAWEKKGLLIVRRDRIALNRDGMLFLNRFLSECMEELCDA